MPRDWGDVGPSRDRDCDGFRDRRGQLPREAQRERRHGGSSDAWNLHLLCPACHVESEDFSLEEKKYWAWLRAKFLRDYREPQQWLARELELMGLTLSELLILYLSGKKDEALQKVEYAFSENHRKRYERTLELLTKNLANPLFKDIKCAPQQNSQDIIEPSRPWETLRAKSSVGGAPSSLRVAPGAQCARAEHGLLEPNLG